MTSIHPIRINIQSSRLEQYIYNEEVCQRTEF